MCFNINDVALCLMAQVRVPNRTWLMVPLVILLCWGSFGCTVGDDSGVAAEYWMTGECVGDCNGKWCGPDGCGGTCGKCGPGAYCSAGYCLGPDSAGSEDDFVSQNDSFIEPDAASLSGPCQVGQSGGWYVVRISDDLTNPTLTPGEGLDCQGNNPGADIDSISIIRGEDEVANAASVIDYEPWADATCDNDKDDADMVLGPQDGVASGTFFGYFSLNGGKITVDFDGGEELLCGDIIAVVEMDSGNPGSVEKYIVDFGASADGPWNYGAIDAVGMFDVEVVWEW